MTTEPTPKPQQPLIEKQAVEKQPVEQQAGSKATPIKLTVTAGKGAPEFVAGIHFPQGREKTITVTPERAALIKRTAGLTVKEIK